MNQTVSRVAAAAAALIVAGAFSACDEPQGPTPPLSVWTPAAPAPLARYEAQGVAVGGRLYVFGGFYTARIEATSRVDAYDIASDTWVRLADMPEAITHAGQAEDGETIYLVGGFAGDHPGPSMDRVWKYHIPSNSWSPGPPLPAPRGAGVAVRLGRTLHFFGGTVREGSQYLYDSADHWTLDLDRGTSWATAAPLPNPRNHLGGVAFGGKIWAIGGQHLGDEEGGNQDAVHLYDPAVDQWSAAPPTPRPLGHVAASVLVREGRIVVVGGVTQGSEEVANVIAFDSRSWSELVPLPSPRQSPVAGLVEGWTVVTTGLGSQPEATTWRAAP